MWIITLLCFVFILTEDFDFDYRDFAYPFNGNAILKMDWTEAGVFLQTANQIKVIDPINHSVKLHLNFTDSIIASCTASILSESKILTAVSLQGRIQIYKNDLMVMNRSTRNPITSMTFDKSSTYFYFFDSFTRYVVDVKQRTIFDQKSIDKNQIWIAASTNSGYEDITASIQFGGKVQIWDHYHNIGTFTLSYPQNYVAFTRDSEYLVTYQNINNKITLWKTNFGSYNSWAVQQSFNQNNRDGLAVCIDVKNDLIVTMVPNVLIIYAKENSKDDSFSVMGLIILIILVIIFTVFGYFALLCPIVYCCCKRVIQENEQTDKNQSIHDQVFSSNPQPTINPDLKKGNPDLKSGQEQSNNTKRSRLRQPERKI